MIERIDTGGVRIGKLLVVPSRQVADGPRLDGCRTVLTQYGEPWHIGQRAVTEVDYSGLCFRYHGVKAIAVGWRGRRLTVLNPRRWRPRFMLRQLIWILRGRPAATQGIRESFPKINGGGEGPLGGTRLCLRRLDDTLDPIRCRKMLVRGWSDDLQREVWACPEGHTWSTTGLRLA